MKIEHKKGSYLAKNIYSILSLGLGIVLPFVYIGFNIFSFFALALIVHELRRFKDRSCVLSMDEIEGGLSFCYLDCFVHRTLNIQYDDMRAEYSGISKKSIVISSIKAGRYWPQSVLLTLSPSERGWLTSNLVSNNVVLY